MNANIVYTGKGENNILDRQAQALSAATGWAYTKSPDPSFDLNHFICYIEFGEKFSDWHLTPISCWFTHYEGHQEWKAFWWELAANNSDLRITAAPVYVDRLAEYGLTRLARPVIDAQFEIREKPKNDKPRVGVAGYVHPGGRKGEKLVARLAGSKLGNRIMLNGSGRGWPCPTRHHEWTDLPGWFNSLDVFLCTSTIEGIPMPPLEALACGVPVVIPREVGLLDLLPDIPGIYRYTAGDFGGMCKALEQALDGEHDRDVLRLSIHDYNAQNWADDHNAAFMDLLAQGPAEAESDRHGRRGVIYVAYGGPSRKCAQSAIASFRQHMHGVEIGLISDEPGLGEDVFIRCNDVDIGGRYAKTKIYELAPQDWQYVMYLDADTEIVADISFLFSVLIDGWDMVICKNPAKYHLAWQRKRSDNHDECDYTFDKIGTGELIQLNGGVFAFQRNERTHAFFEAWHREWNKWGKRDQGALLRALFAHPLRLYVLGNEWNTVTRYMDKAQSAGILHYPMAARRWRGKVVQRSDSKAAWDIVRAFEKANP